MFKEMFSFEMTMYKFFFKNKDFNQINDFKVGYFIPFAHSFFTGVRNENKSSSSKPYDETCQFSLCIYFFV